MPTNQKLTIHSIHPIPLIPLQLRGANLPKGSQPPIKSRKTMHLSIRYNLITNFKTLTASVPRTGNPNQYQKRFNPSKITQKPRNHQIRSNRNCHSLLSCSKRKNQLQKSARIITCPTTINSTILYQLSSLISDTRENNSRRRRWAELRQ